MINKSSTPRDRNADLLIKEPIGQVFSQNKSEQIILRGEKKDMGLIYDVGDIVTLKKGHPCGSKEWEILRVGVDFSSEMHGVWTYDHGST